jgi:ABC-2 type transport system permease protein
LRLWKSWVVATKDFSVFRKNRYVFSSLIAIPLIFGVVVPSALLLPLPAGKVPLSTVTLLINLSTWYFVVVAAVLPTVIGSYSFVGEKIEKSLEPLLATPTRDSELLLGKSLAAFLPSIAATYVGAAIFVTIVDAWSYVHLGVFLLPNSEFAGILGLIVPLGCVLSVETSLIISSRVNDVRAAQQLGGLVVLPLILLVLLSATGQTVSAFLIIAIVSGILAVADIALFYLSIAVFKREEILTKWK